MFPRYLRIFSQSMIRHAAYITLSLSSRPSLHDQSRCKQKNHPKPIDRLHTKFLYCDLALTCQLELRFGTYGTFGGPSDENPWLLTTLKAKNRVIPFQPRPFSPMPPGKSTAACAGRWMGGLFRLLVLFLERSHSHVSTFAKSARPFFIVGDLQL